MRYIPITCVFYLKKKFLPCLHSTNVVTQLLFKLMLNNTCVIFTNKKQIILNTIILK